MGQTQITEARKKLNNI